MKPLNLEHVRAEFPALAGDTVYLDNAGGSLVLRRVADRVRDYLLTSSVQLGASYAASQAAGAKVLAVMQALAHTGVTMVIVTHEMGFARRVADRVVFMEDGVVVEQAPPEAFFSAPREARTQAFLQAILPH